MRGPVYDAAVLYLTVCREQFSLLLPVGHALEHADLSTNLATLGKASRLCSFRGLITRAIGR